MRWGATACVAVVSTCLPVQVYAQGCVSPPSGIIAWWGLDETSGTTSSDRTGNHPGTHANGPVPTVGQIRNGLRFDGRDEFVTVPDSHQWAFGANNFSIELWSKFGSPGGGSLGHPSHIFIGSDEGPFNRNKWFFALGGGFLNFHINGPSIGPKFFPLAPFAPALNQWYHLAITRQVSTYTIYINGAPVTSATNTDAVPDAAAVLTIAQAEFIGFTNGTLDEITIYNRALTSTELRSIYDAGTAGKCKDLGIRPQSGGDTGSTTVVISGGTFVEGSSVKLTRPGFTDIEGTNVEITEGGASLGATFDLAGRSQGIWNVAVTNSNGGTFSLPGGFSIEEGRSPQLWVDIVGLGLMRPGREQTYWITYGNRGNVDAWGGTVYVGIPAGVEHKIGSQTTFSISGQDRILQFLFTRVAPGETHFMPLSLRIASLRSIELRADISTGFGKYPGLGERFAPAALGVAAVKSLARYAATDSPERLVQLTEEGLLTGAGRLGGRAGYIHFFRIRKPDGTYEIQTGIELPDGRIAWSFPRIGISIAPFIPDGTWDAAPGYHIQQIEGIRPFHDEAQMDAFSSNLTLWLREYGYKPYCNGCTELGCEAFNQRTCRSCLGFVLDMLSQGGLRVEDLPLEPGPTGSGFTTTGLLYYLLKSAGYSREDILSFIEGLNLPPGTKKQLIDAINSFDPNDKSGPVGNGPAKFVSATQPLRYSVFFENKETASAPAQEITITDQLNPLTMDLGTFSLGPIAFGARQVVPPPGLSDFVTVVDLRPAKNLLVSVEGHLDRSTGIANWRFTSLDPTTGRVPDDPLAGFLAPNRVPPEGDGSVSFSVIPNGGIPTGTAVRNLASIVFDFNPAILTPEWTNTIDASNPSSRVLPLSAQQSQLSFPVDWQGSDSGSGVRGYTVYVSDNGGAFAPWQVGTTATQAIFAGLAGHTYSFYSIAGDLAGNQEPPKTIGEATTRVDVSACAAVVSDQTTLTRTGFRFNASTQRFVQTVTMRNASATAIQGPVSLVLDGLSSNATLFNRTGVTACEAPTGSSYININVGADNLLSPGETATAIPQFTNPTNQGITYGTRVLAGNGNR